jgi:hypothetical protein
MTAVQTIKMLEIWAYQLDPATALLLVAVAVTCFAAFKIARHQS